LASFTFWHQVVVVKTTSKTVLIAGEKTGSYTVVKGRNLSEWLAERQIPATWSASQRGWFVRNERIADLVAMAEHEGLIVKVSPS
jgi:hypothetical protein